MHGLYLLKARVPPLWGELCMLLDVEGLNCKRPNPICRLFFKIDLLTDIAALCLTDFFYRLEIHSLIVWYFRPSL
jgi:hypothetical protein